MEVKMLDNYDSETLVKIYRLLNKKCQAIDGFIKNHALNFGSCSAEFGTEDVCNNIIELITKKNQLIMDEFCSVLELKERTAFRRIERAFTNLTVALNHSKYLEKLISIMNKEVWIARLREDVKARRLAYRTA